MPKFFVSSPAPDSGPFQLGPEAAAHARSLRMQPGDRLILCDGRGRDYHSVISQCTSDTLHVQIESSAPSISEPSVFVTLYVAFAKGDKMEHVMQKATELGAGAVALFPCSRCVSRPDAASLKKKQERWQKIFQAAAEQSGRGRIPQLFILDSYSQALTHAAMADVAIFLYENEQRRSLRQALESSSFQTLSILSGPEGGFSPEEAQLAERAGLRSCSLGPRILRCETAPLCALTAAMYATGQLDAFEK